MKIATKTATKTATKIATKKRGALWPVWLGMAWMVLCGTTPGSVGSCGSDELGATATFRDYCQKREELTCVRRFLRKEITVETRDACRWDAVDACARRNFTGNCRPTLRITEACLTALASFDTLSTPESDIPECQTKALCSVLPSDEADAAVGGSGFAGAGGE